MIWPNCFWRMRPFDLSVGAMTPMKMFSTASKPVNRF